MKNLVSGLLLAIIGASIVACNSGGSSGGTGGLQVSFNPNKCSLSQNKPVTLSYSGLTNGESASFTTLINGQQVYSTGCIVGSSGCFLQTESSETDSCSNLAGVGIYTYVLQQGSSKATAQLEVVQ